MQTNSRKYRFLFLYLHFFSFFFLYCFSFNIADATSAISNNIILDTRYDYDETKKQMRFVIESTQAPEYNIITLKKPNRLVIDLKNTQKQNRNTILLSNNLTNKIRFGIQQKTNLRIVLDLKNDISYHYKTFILEPSSSKNYRLVTDIFISPPLAPLALNDSNIKENNSPTLKITPPIHSIQKNKKEIEEQPKILSLNIKQQPKTTPKEASSIEILPPPNKSTTIPIPLLRLDALSSPEKETNLLDVINVALITTPNTNVTNIIPILKAESPDTFRIPPPGKSVDIKHSHKQVAIPYIKPTPPEPKKTPKDKKRIIPHVIIDPGHGGKDPGAIGKGRKYEKDITLSYAKALKKRLEKGEKYRVTLTRKGDYYVSLRERVQKARRYDGDIFISLHADSHPRTDVRGLSVYTLSENASDKEAERLAARENKEDIIEGVNLQSEEFQITDILIDLIQRDTKNKSSILAEKIIKHLSSEVRILRNAHRFAGFRVLTTHDIPSVLVELGYISNKKEARNLTSKRYQRKIIKSLEKAIDAYFTNVI